ncbi:MAG: Slp family lipoprotein [Syntrophales bacterium]|nr:Slp family lipoprotein [Syntrophales bacterium]
MKLGRIVAKAIRLAAPAAVLLLVCCAPVLTDRSIREATLSITFQQLQKDPDAYKGRVVILGGKIIQATVREGETWLEILQQPLDRRYKPENTDVSYGRFFVVMKGFADPVIYSPGRRITVSGEVTGKIVQPINSLQYTYPVLSPREHTLLPREDYYGNPPRLYYGAGVGITN